MKKRVKLFSLCISNNEKGLKKVKKELKKHKILPSSILLCLENSGFYGNLLAFWAIENAYAVWIENPISIKRSMGLVRGKNDVIDAHRIALYSARFQDKCRLWNPPRQVIANLRQLNTTRERLIRAIKMLKTPLKESKFVHASATKQMERSCKGAIKGVEKSILKIDEEIDQLIKNDEKLSKMMKIITSVGGIGTQIAIVFILVTNEFQDMKDPNKIACYAGVAPFENKSGTSIQGRTKVSHLANKKLKALIHMGALSAIKTSQEMKAYYERKIEEGKSKMAIINAVRNKLIARICACVRDNRMYEQEYSRGQGT